MTVIRFTGDKSYFDQPVSVALEFEINGYLVTPDDGSVTYVLTGPDGSLVLSDTVAAGSTVLTIPATANQMAVGEDTSVRFLDMTFTDGGLVKSHQLAYYLLTFVPMVVNPASVRALLGVDASELPDECITLYQTYVALKRDLGLDPFADPLKRLEANDLVLYAEALKQARSLHLKVLQRSKIDDHLKERAEINLKNLYPSLEAEYLKAYRHFGAVQEVIQFESVTTRTDPVTGA